MALGWYEAHTSVDNQLARLRMLLIMVHSVVEQAERVHIATWWLRGCAGGSGLSGTPCWTGTRRWRAAALQVQTTTRGAEGGNKQAVAGRRRWETHGQVVAMVTSAGTARRYTEPQP